jgi:hypothetical protein
MSEPSIVIPVSPKEGQPPILSEHVIQGEKEPWTHQVVEVLIEICPRRWVVFLNKSYDTWWWHAPEAKPEGYDLVVARVAQLEAIEIEHLPENQRRAFRCLVAQGMARVFDGDQDAAGLVLDQAEEYVGARLAEMSRVWYLLTTLPVAIAVMAVMVFSAETAHAVSSWPVAILTTGSGALGACISLVVRMGSFPADPNAGRRLHVLEVLARVGVGVLSGWLVLLGASLGVALDPATSLAGLMLAGFAAGATERFVPNLVSKADGGGVAGAPKPVLRVLPSTQRALAAGVGTAAERRLVRSSGDGLGA